MRPDRAGRDGTVEARTGFGARFRPASNRIRRRWERIALAHRTGRTLPPITLVRRPDGHYVTEGCHRESVARGIVKPVERRAMLFFAPAVLLTTLIFATVLAVVRSWGRIRGGRTPGVQRR